MRTERISTGVVFCLTGIILHAWATGAGAQHAHPPHPGGQTGARVAESVRQARAATQEYHRLETAIAAGYRLMGPDMPNMGEHWIHPGFAMEKGIDLMHPAVLTYVRKDGAPVLTGVAYLVPVLPGESPPDVPLPATWHYHSAGLEEEAFGLTPHGMHEGLLRLAMFHAWIWTENPAGLFAADNWALPFVRLGLPVPQTVPPPAAKALFLLSGGVAYYARAIQVAGAPGPSDRVSARAVLSRYRDLVEGAVKQAQKSNGADSALPEELQKLWNAMWDEIQARASRKLWARIQVLAAGPALSQ